MAYGTVKVDNITFDNGGSDQNVTVSGLYRATTSGVTLSGTIAATTVSGVTVIGSTTVSGATVTGTTANFTSGNFSNIISSAATMSGALIMANQQQVRFREAVGNGVNHIALQAPAIVSADQTITLPDQTGTVITTGDNGSVSSTMLATNLTISAAAGSATTPSIAFTGDLNTGIYSPGADQLAVSTGGTGRLFVDATGNVGLGTGATNIAGFKRIEIGEAGVSGGLLTLRSSGGAQEANISCSATGLAFTTNSYATPFDARASEIILGTGSSGTECLRIDSSGRVGIGTASPSQKLHVSGIILGDSNDNYFGSYSSGGAYLDIGNLATSATWLDARSTSLANVPVNIRAKGTGEIAFHQTSGEKVRIDSSGRVGIGTSSPGYKLEVYGDGTSTGTLGLINPSATNGAAIYFGDSNQSSAIKTIPTAGTHSLGFFVAGSNTERLRIDSSGRLLVGTSSARTNFRIGSTNYEALQQLEMGSQGFQSLVGGLAQPGGPHFMLAHQRSGAVGGNTAVLNGDELGVVSFHGSDGTNLVIGASVRGEVDGTPGANDMPGRLVFSTTADGAAGTTERMRIDSSGRVGIGSSTPYQRMTVADNSTSVASGSTLSVVGGTPNMTGEGGSISLSNFHQGAVNHAARIRSGLLNAAAHEAGDLIFDTNGGAGLVERMKIGSDGKTVFKIPNTTVGFCVSDPNDNGVLIIGGDAGTGNRPGLKIRYGSADQIWLNGDGNAYKPGGGSWAATSDLRSKEDIVDYTSGLDQLKQIQPRSYRYIGNENTYIGLVAQEVEDAMPELVRQGEGTLPDGTEVTDFRTLDQTPLTFALINAVKEMAEQIERLQAEVALLKGE